jgi:hypothetical protein
MVSLSNQVSQLIELLEARVETTHVIAVKTIRGSRFDQAADDTDGDVDRLQQRLLLFPRDADRSH